MADALLNRIGAPPWIVDHVVLGHARPKLLWTYMPTLPLGEARDALQRWGDELERILGAPQSLKARPTKQWPTTPAAQGGIMGSDHEEEGHGSSDTAPQAQEESLRQTR